MLALACALLSATVHKASAWQQEEIEVRDPTRGSWAKKRGGPPPDKTEKYKITKAMPKGPAISPAAEDSEIGVTVWRWRIARSNEAVEIKDLRQRGKAKEEWTQERVASDTEFQEGQEVSLSIESLRTGFLYVINRAKYKDGTYGDPYLIFPTKRIYGGDNRVEAGRATQIPGPDEEPFTLERSESRPNELQQSEELIVLVMPQPLQSFSVAPPAAQRLTQQSVENLIKKYGAPYEVSDQIGGAGHVITAAEKRATKTAESRLGAKDPYQQTIYRLATKAGDPMLVVFELKVRGK